MNYDKIFSHTITAVLLGMAGYHQSAAFAYATVASLAVMAAHEIYSRLLALREVKPTVSDEVKRTIQDMNARIATLEYGVKTRGF